MFEYLDCQAEENFEIVPYKTFSVLGNVQAELYVDSTVQEIYWWYIHDCSDTQQVPYGVNQSCFS